MTCLRLSFFADSSALPTAAHTSPSGGSTLPFRPPSSGIAGAILKGFRSSGGGSTPSLVAGSSAFHQTIPSPSASAASAAPHRVDGQRVWGNAFSLSERQEFIIERLDCSHLWSCKVDARIDRLQSLPDRLIAREVARAVLFPPAVLVVWLVEHTKQQHPAVDELLVLYAGRTACQMEMVPLRPVAIAFGHPRHQHHGQLD